MRTFIKKLVITVLVMVTFTIITPETVPFMNVPVAEAATLKLSVRTKTLTIGDKFVLKVINKSAKDKIKWKSSNTKVAKVYESGTVKGFAVGEAKITATIGKKVLTCLVTVEQEVVNVPDITASMITPESGTASVALMLLTNNGDLPLTINSYAYVLNDGYPNLGSAVYLFDTEDPDYAFIESMTIEPFEDAQVWYRQDDADYYFWLDDDTYLMFNFTYDDIEFNGTISNNGTFMYSQGFLGE